MPAGPGASSLPPLRDVIARYGLSARKSLGQHFLLDMNLTRRIVRAAGPLEGRTVIEVGPGPGGLTRALLESRARRVIAVERDRRCIGALADLQAVHEGRLEIVEADALESHLWVLGDVPRQIVANLPYNIGTALVIQWLQRPEAFEAMTLMFQKEVAERLTARPGNKSWGRLGVLANWRWKATRLFDVPPTAFVPPPQITSSVVRFEPRPPSTYAAADPALLERITAAAFGQRRKMLRSALKALGGDADALIAAAGLEPTARAEKLPVEAFCALARAVAAAGH